MLSLNQTHFRQPYLIISGATFFCPEKFEMAVAGVKNVEIPRVANLSPERFHRLERNTLHTGRQIISLETTTICEGAVVVFLGQGFLHKGATSYHHRCSGGLAV